MELTETGLSTYGATHMRKKSLQVNLRPRLDLNLNSTVRNSDVDEIGAKLSEKHKGEYSKDQLRAWAHTINMGKYALFWRGRKWQCGDQAPSSKQPTSFVASPSKKSWDQVRVDYSVEAVACITRVWSSLSKYDEMKSATTDMKELQKRTRCDQDNVLSSNN